MLQATTFRRPPLALIASGHEWLARSFESILGPNGYAVLRAYTSKQAIDQARSAPPDAVFLDSGLADLSCVEVCRTLRHEPTIVPQTPIFVTTTGPISRHERLDVLRAGALGVLSLPLDAEEILLQLSTCVTAKLDADRAREESLLDPWTGLYNMRGLLRRAEELGTDAFRHHRALACVVICPDAPREGTALRAAPLDRLPRLFREACRASDAIGRMGGSDYVVLAPNTGPSGAFRLAERLAHAAESAHEDAEDPTPALAVRVGFFAVPDFHEAALQPMDMLVRATTALRYSQSRTGASRIQAFDLSQSIVLS